MPGNLSLDALRSEVAAGVIDTVLVCMVDMQGRLMGKRFHAAHFLDHAITGTHCCNYLLATDLEMATVQGYASTSWQAGYGDNAMRPDLSTLRRVPWLEGTAMVLADVLDHHGKHLVAHSPRSMLQRQVARLSERGLTPIMATELEFFLFDQSFDAIRAAGYRGLAPASGYNEDYHIFQTTKEEGVMRAIRNGLVGAGIPVESTKGEAEAGQAELNIRYSDALDAADNHAIAKNACKEIAWSKGHAVTFLAKWHEDRVGSSSHVHQSLRDAEGRNAFHDPDAPSGMSPLMRSWTAGLLDHAVEITAFLAPYVNSYKRFRSASFAPTRNVWSVDNRTAGFRLCGEDTPGVRIECRIGGSDMNPHLAMAALIAAGLSGVERGLDLPPPHTGDAYAEAGTIPSTLPEAAAALHGSAMLRTAFGDDVIDHYHRAALWEVEEYNRVVTDWEVARGFERA